MEILKEFIRLNDNEYLGTLNGMQLVEMWEENKIVYQPDIQRGTKIVIDKVTKQKVHVPIYSEKNVKSISNTMKDKYFVDTITLNIMPSFNHKKEVEYDKYKRVLQIKEGKLALLDGQHRLRALLDLYRQGKTKIVEGYTFPLKITNYNKAEAQAQFRQFTLATRISASRAEFFDNKKTVNRIAKMIYDDSVLAGKIETTKNSIFRNDTESVITYSTLVRALEMSFNFDSITTEKEIIELTTYLKEFLAELFNAIPEFNSYQERWMLKENNIFMCDNFTFYGVFRVASTLRNMPDYKKYISLYRKINFDKTSELWSNAIIKLTEKKKKDNFGNIQYGYNIVNNNSSRKSFADMIEKEFKILMYS